MNFIDKGIEWFEQKRKSQTTEQVRVTTSTLTKTVLASVIDPESNANSQGLRIVSNDYIFLITKAVIANLDIKRGVQITRLKTNEVYVVVAPNRTTTEYNDANNTTKAISAKLNATD